MDPSIHLDIPRDEGAVFGTRLLYALLKQIPSSQLKLGDRELERARNITHHFESVIGKDDCNIIYERITFAQEVKARVDFKRGISRFRPAREYFRAARSACQYAKHASARGLDDAGHSHISRTFPTPTSEFIFNRVMSVARPLYRCYLSCQDAFPSHDMMDDWLAYVWFEACARTEVDPCSLTFPHPNELVISTIALLTDMKAKITHLVESLYGFDTSQAPDSICHNARRAQALLTNMAYVSREPNSGGALHHQYRHPIVQNVINMTWFQDKDADGIVFHEHFNPIPIQTIALTLTVVECCINEWIDGTYRVSDWDEHRYSGAYYSHISSLSDLRDPGLRPPEVDLLAQIQSDALKDARIHAGAPSEPVTGSGRLDTGALDAAILRNIPQTENFDHGSIPAIVVSPPGT